MFILFELTDSNMSCSKYFNLLFQVRATDMDGTKTLRNLSGLRRDSEVMFVSPKDLGLDASDGVNEEASSLYSADSPGGGGRMRPAMVEANMSTCRGSNAPGSTMPDRKISLIIGSPALMGGAFRSTETRT